MGPGKRKTIAILRIWAVVVETITRRRPLPGGRAAVGGLLVALAAVGTFAAASGATADPRRAYVVARADLAVGHRIERSDLAAGRMDLPAFVRRRAFGDKDAARLVGALVVGPISRGELVQAGAVRLGGAPGAGRQVSFPVDPARAVGGELQPGEFVDVLATDDGPTTVVVRGARVAAVRDRGGLAGGDSLVITLDVADIEAAVALAHAVDVGHVTVVRSGPVAND